MLFSPCKFCGCDNVFSFLITRKKRSIEYFRCDNCKAISLSDKEFLSISQQLHRYSQHNNFLTDLGYAQFLGDFLLNTFTFLPNFTLSRILDYGSGPNPALVELLGLVSQQQRSGKSTWVDCEFNEISSLDSYVDYLAHKLPFLPSKNDIGGWDPFFAPDGIKVQVPLVLCLEVAEHFEKPWDGFAGLAECCCVGGYVAVGTLQIPDTMVTTEDFNKWWYKDDRTHVSFYTEKAMEACGKKCGLQYLGKASPRIFMFKKLEDAPTKN